MATTFVRHLLRASILVALVAAVLASLAGDAAAEDQSPYDVAVGQMAACEAMGGDATYEGERTTGSGVTYTSVSCSGGLLGGISCDNGFKGSSCYYGSSRVGGGKDGRVIRGGVVDLAPVIDEPVAVDDVDTHEDRSEPVNEPVDQPEVADEAVTGEEPTVAKGPVAEEPAVVEDTGSPATTVESVEPGVVEEPVVDTVPVDMSISFPTTADEGEEKGA